MFPSTSRYHGIETETFELPDGRTVAYLKRRFVPPPERFEAIEEHEVSDGDRLDLLAFRYLGDAELFWRLCDANNALRPDELLEPPWRKLRITLPEGVLGAAKAVGLSQQEMAAAFRESLPQP